MKKKNETIKAKPEPVETNAPVVNWNDSEMETEFANVVNIQSTKDQVDIFFGTNKTWNLTEGNDVSIDLSNRIILTPLVAKRMHLSLGQLLEEHEKRHGKLEV